MRSPTARISLLAACVLVVSLVAAPASSQKKGFVKSLDQRLDRDVSHLAGSPSSSARRHPVLDNFRLVGHTNFGGRIQDFGDVYGHGNFAYIGTRCGATAQGGYGVGVVNISNPHRPRPVSRLHNPLYTRAEDVTVLNVKTPAFRGVLAVVGIQACFDSGHEASVVPGLRFFDVTHPAHPVLLGRYNLPRGTVGCHELDAVQRSDGRVLAGCARNLVDHFTSNGRDAVHIVNATNPARPRTITKYTMNADPEGGVGCLPFQFAHSIRFENGGRSLYVSYWDAGTVHLNISRPASPVEISDTKIVPPDEDGDNHSMTLANGGKWLIINPEDGSPLDCPGESAFGAFGEAYVYDNTNPRKPVFLGTFATDNTTSTRTDGIYDVHNTETVLGTQFFSSWYSDGIVWWRMNKHGSSRQLGQFVPPTAAGTPPLVWGVYPDHARDLVLASDITSGLWIIRPKGLNF